MGPGSAYAQGLPPATYNLPMIETTDDGTDASGVVAVRLDDGGLLLYETDNQAAWIESDVALVVP